jgi:hypothetical protein
MQQDRLLVVPPVRVSLPPSLRSLVLMATIATEAKGPSACDMCRKRKIRVDIILRHVRYLGLKKATFSAASTRPVRIVSTSEFLVRTI